MRKRINQEIGVDSLHVESLILIPSLTPWYLIKNIPQAIFQVRYSPTKKKGRKRKGFPEAGTLFLIKYSSI